VSAPEPYTPEPGAIITLAGRVPVEGWEVRRYSSDVWTSPNLYISDAWSSPNLIDDHIVEARPIPKPPLMVGPVDRDAVYRFLRCNFGSYAAPIVEAIHAALAAESES